MRRTIAVCLLFVTAGCLVSPTGPARTEADPSTTTPPVTPEPTGPPTTTVSSRDRADTTTATDRPATVTPTPTRGTELPGRFGSAGNLTQQEYRLKRALVREFRIGTTFGMPTIVTGDRINRTVDRHPTLAERIRRDFDPIRKVGVYRRIEQFRQVSLQRLDDDTFGFQISSGNTCSITSITGTIDADGENVTVANRSSREVPC